MFRERVRVRFARRGTIRFVSHLDMMRLFERALRRAGLPLRMTEGFNRRPRISFPLPLAVGWEALNEVMEFELADWTRAPEVRQRLSHELPEGVTLGGLTLVEGSRKAQPVEAVYEAAPVTLEAARRVGPGAAAAFLKRDACRVERTRKKKLKQVDIRPFVRDIVADGGKFVMRIACSPDGSAKPEEVLSIMGLSRQEIVEGFRVVRTRVRLRGEEG